MADGARSDNPAVQKQLDRLEMLSPGRDVLGLERILEVLGRIGNPHKKLPPTFHVAGTNGKGSTCAFLRAAIEAEGLACHVYTSPHLVRFNERIRLAGSLIEDNYLAALLSRVLDISEDISPSFFEATTAAAFLAFAETPADACVVEVGLGGRLDATNVIRQPVATGIAALGIDHEAFLLSPEPGAPKDPMTRIAWEKAGIAKAGVPLVTQKYSPGMVTAISQHCDDIGAIFCPRGEDWDAAIYEEQVHYRDQAGKLAVPLPGLSGPHQADNAALALAMLRQQDILSISEPAMKAAMGWVNWPGRMQRLATGPVTGLLPPGTEIWLDGGHNISAGQALAKHFEDYAKGSIDCVIGMLSNKDPSAILGPLQEQLASVTIVPIAGHDTHPASAFQNFNSDIRERPDFQAALSDLSSKPNAVIIITGSLYLAGAVLKANDQWPD